MKSENLFSSSVQRGLKFGLVGLVGFVGLSMSVFILWSLTCIGSACFEFARTLT